MFWKKSPVYQKECPKHGVVSMSIYKEPDGTTTFCPRCCIEKFKEIGILVLTETVQQAK